MLHVTLSNSGWDGLDLSKEKVFSEPHTPYPIPQTPYPKPQKSNLKPETRNPNPNWAELFGRALHALAMRLYPRADTSAAALNSLLQDSAPARTVFDAG